MTVTNIKRQRDEDDDDDLVIGDAVSARVAGLIERHGQLKNRYGGSGKITGGPASPTPDDYDLEVVTTLIKKGVVDRHELATAIWHRPNSNAQANGLDYVLNTVTPALLRLTGLDAEAAKGPVIDFVVDRVRIEDADDPDYELTIDGQRVRITNKEMMVPSKVAERILAATKRFPLVPHDKKGIDDWRKLVNEWLEGAERVELEEDANPRVALAKAVDRVLEGLPDGTEAADLDLRRCIRDTAAGVVYVKTAVVRGELKQHGLERVADKAICQRLRELGAFDTHTVDAAGGRARCWKLVPCAFVPTAHVVAATSASRADDGAESDAAPPNASDDAAGDA